MALPPPWVSDLLVGFSVMCTARAFCSPGRTWIGYRVAPRVIAILSLPERFRQWLWSLGSNPVFSGGSVGRLPIAVLMGHYKRLVLLKSMLSLSVKLQPVLRSVASRLTEPAQFQPELQFLWAQEVLPECSSPGLHSGVPPCVLLVSEGPGDRLWNRQAGSISSTGENTEKFFLIRSQQ